MSQATAHDDVEPVRLDAQARARLRQARAWLRRYVQWWGWRTAASRAGCSTEAIARFLAGFPVQRRTIERIQRLADDDRETQAARRAAAAAVRF